MLILFDFLSGHMLPEMIDESCLSVCRRVCACVCQKTDQIIPGESDKKR